MSSMQASHTMECFSSGMKSPTDKTTAELRLSHVLLCINRLVGIGYTLCYHMKIKKSISEPHHISRRAAHEWLVQRNKAGCMVLPMVKYLSLKKVPKDTVTPTRQTQLKSILSLQLKKKPWEPSGNEDNEVHYIRIQPHCRGASAGTGPGTR